ncbi:hypothetical protein Lal_00003677 [Lupinus albus]|nr:hypothetical protein Lal_00003677 [Lupinus albus]
MFISSLTRLGFGFGFEFCVWRKTSGIVLGSARIGFESWLLTIKSRMISMGWLVQVIHVCFQLNETRCWAVQIG